MKRLTVIIPIYNAEKKISTCLDSILPQLTEEDELLLINDGSNDNSLMVITSYKEKYPYIRIIDKENEGVSKTRNLGIKEAKGTYICFVDNDDYVCPDYFDTYYKAIKDTKFDMVMGGYQRVSTKGVQFSVKASDSDWYKLMVVAPWAKIYRRQFLLEHNIEFLDYGIGEDNFFNFQVYTKTDKVKIIPYTGYNWWFNDESISNTSQRGFKKNVDITFLMNSLYKLTSGKGIYNYYYLRYVVWYLLFSGKSAKSDDFLKEYQKDFSWLKEHNISQNFLKYQTKIKGESFLNRVIVGIFVVLHKLRLVKIFSKLYCKA